MTKPHFYFSFLLHLAAALLPASGHLLPIITASGAPPDRFQTYIIHVLRPNDNDYTSDDHRLSHHLSFLPTKLLDTGEPRLIYSYSHAISGFAARLTPDELQQVESKPGFVLAVQDRDVVRPQTTYTPYFLGLDPDSGTWPESEFGEGTIVALIDTGVDPNHLSFADDGTLPPPPKKWRGRCDFPAGVCNNKLIGAIAFRGGTNPSPLDDGGHGTHTASTAAGAAVHNASVLGQAAGVATGVAPRAHLAVYKVLFGGSGRFSDVIAGIDRAISDGADVLSMSLGAGPSELYQNGIATASYAAMLRGIFPSAAAGNSGPSSSSVSNDAPWMLTVGASTTDRRIKATLFLGNGKSLDGEAGYQPNMTAIPFAPIVSPSDCSPSTLAQIGVSGKIVACPISNVVQTGTDVKNAGGAALVVLGPAQWGLLTFSDVNVLPAVHLNHPNGVAVQAYVASASSPVAALAFKGTQFGAPKSPAIAAFSSRGPSAYNGGILKPDVVGPGVNVMAAWPYVVGPDPNVGPKNKLFNFLSGTSMATPHLSGVAAIVKKLHPEWSVAAVKSAIVTTAYSTDENGSPITDQYPDSGPPAAFFATGAGHVDASRAAEPGLVYDVDVKDYIGYMCGLGYTDAQVKAVTQSNVKCATIKNITTEQLNYPSIVLNLVAGTTKRVTRTVTNVGKSESIYEVKYIAPTGVSIAITPNKLSFSAAGEKKSFTIEFSRETTSKQGNEEAVQGELRWVNGKVTVRSPIVVNLT